MAAWRHTRESLTRKNAQSRAQKCVCLVYSCSPLVRATSGAAARPPARRPATGSAGADAAASPLQAKTHRHACAVAHTRTKVLAFARVHRDACRARRWWACLGDSHAAGDMANLLMGAAAMSNLLMSPTRAPSRSRHTASTSTSQALDRSCLGARGRHRVCDF
jgi:hypothetical protein